MCPLMVPPDGWPPAVLSYGRVVDAGRGLLCVGRWDAGSFDSGNPHVCELVNNSVCHTHGHLITLVFVNNHPIVLKGWWSHAFLCVCHQVIDEMDVWCKIWCNPPPWFGVPVAN